MEKLKKALDSIMDDIALPYSREREIEQASSCLIGRNFEECTEWDLFIGCQECKNYIIGKKKEDYD